MGHINSHFYQMKHQLVYCHERIAKNLWVSAGKASATLQLIGIIPQRSRKISACWVWRLFAHVLPGRPTHSVEENCVAPFSFFCPLLCNDQRMFLFILLRLSMVVEA